MPDSVSDTIWLLRMAKVGEPSPVKVELLEFGENVEAQVV